VASPSLFSIMVDATLAEGEIAAALWVTMLAALLLYMRANDLTLSELFLAGMAWVQDNPLAPLASWWGTSLPIYAL
jgi:hypothetical protein